MDKVSQQAKCEQWKKHVIAWEQSGLTQSAYCRVHGIALGTFHAWVGRVKKMSSPAEALTLVPVVVEGAAEHSHLSSPLSLQHKNGWRLELPADIAADWVVKVLKELA